MKGQCGFPVKILTFDPQSRGFLAMRTIALLSCTILRLWRRTWQSTPVILPGKFHGPRSMAGYSPCDCKESATAERLSTSSAIRSVKSLLRDFPGGPVIKNLPASAGDTGSTPGLGTKIPHAAGQLSLCATTLSPHPGAQAPQQEKQLQWEARKLLLLLFKEKPYSIEDGLWQGWAWIWGWSSQGGGKWKALGTWLFCLSTCFLVHLGEEWIAV